MAQVFRFFFFLSDPARIEKKYINRRRYLVLFSLLVRNDMVFVYALLANMLNMVVLRAFGTIQPLWEVIVCYMLFCVISYLLRAGICLLSSEQRR